MPNITRTASGLLAINAWNGDALPGSSTPFVSGDWTSSTGVTQSVIANGSLRLATGVGWYVTQRTSIVSRSKTFQFIDAVDSIAQTGTIGPAVHITAVTSATCAFGGFTIARPTQDLNRILTITAGSIAVTSTANVAAKAINTHYKGTGFADGTAITFRDLTGASTVSATLATSSGKVGFGTNGATFDVARWIAATDRYVTVTGVPTGGSAEIRTPSATTLVSGSETAGTATLDLFGTDAAQAQSIHVKDSGGTVLATYQDTSGGASNNLIAGGDTFVFIPVSAGRVSQVGALSVEQGAPAGRVSQVGALSVEQGAPAGRVSQVGALIVEQLAAVRVSQVGGLAVVQGQPAARASQVGALTVWAGSPKTRVSQTGVLVVYSTVAPPSTTSPAALLMTL